MKTNYAYLIATKIDDPSRVCASRIPLDWIERFGDLSKIEAECLVDDLTETMTECQSEAIAVLVEHIDEISIQDGWSLISGDIQIGFADTKENACFMWMAANYPIVDDTAWDLVE